MENFDLNFLEKVKEINDEYLELTDFVNSIEVMSDHKLFLHYQKKLKKIEPINLMYLEILNLKQELSDNIELEKLEKDEATVTEIKLERIEIEKKIQERFEQLKQEYLNLNTKSEQRVIVEIRLKSGNLEDFLVLKNIFINYCENFAEQFEKKESGETELTLNVFGENVYHVLSVFSGNCKIVNRSNETISTIVVLLKENQKMEFDLDDIEIETYKSGGAGGQHINKTESAIRVIHKPTGIVSVCQDERSQLKNKERAIENLKSKLEKEFLKKTQKDIDFQRKSIKNALFSSTSVFELNFDTNCASYYKLKKSYNLKQILDGNLNLISNDVVINDRKI